ncbi:Sucrase/ferredoxin-like-domain-containing protein [Mycena pura]|uniref:Sucrase/ferredoxin-like-domain-containing protein n=1 Tax=Mycena pura TaxID=153505 RepID=A0AAD7E5J3_9AGAR|nr:Sucrase/ferredoxin-like-domain-containing protein [Mycena pura]
MSLRRLRALVLGQEPPPPDNVYATLTASGIPVASVDCRTCPNPCEEGHAEYPRRFSIDMESTMLGSVKPFRRQILISTGKSDWDREVTETIGSLAALVAQTHPPKLPDPLPDPPPPIAIDLDEKLIPPIPGVFTSADSTRLSILNGSHKTVAADDEHHTVLVFPDYTMVVDVPATLDGAKELWRTALDATLPRMGGTPATGSFQTWILPYSCVIMLCSHKRRDNRCAIAAPKLEHGQRHARISCIHAHCVAAFIKSLECNGWTAHTQLEHVVDPPLEHFSGTPEEKGRHIADQLRALSAGKRALILRNSHMGGHKYAGNCIIYTPQGSSVWYGRVTTHEVECIVVNTILAGLVLPPLLRGGMDLSRPGCPTLHDW